MPTWLKVLLAVLLAAIVFLAGGAFFAYHWFHTHRAQLVEAGAAVRREGAVFGRGRDTRQCVEESIRRLHTSREFTNEVRTRLFLGGCLSVAAEPPAFCESVPRQGEIAASAEWTINECRNLDAAEISRCSRVMQEVLRYCDSAQARRHPEGQTSK
jgi:hypothetical protein